MIIRKIIIGLIILIVISLAMKLFRGNIDDENKLDN
jgi:hypothetical protein